MSHGEWTLEFAERWLFALERAVDVIVLAGSEECGELRAHGAIGGEPCSRGECN